MTMSPVSFESTKVLVSQVRNGALWVMPGLEEPDWLLKACALPCLEKVGRNDTFSLTETA